MKQWRGKSSLEQAKKRPGHAAVAQIICEPSSGLCGCRKDHHCYLAIVEVIEWCGAAHSTRSHAFVVGGGTVGHGLAYLAQSAGAGQRKMGIRVGQIRDRISSCKTRVFARCNLAEMVRSEAAVPGVIRTRGSRGWLGAVGQTWGGEVAADDAMHDPSVTCRRVCCRAERHCRSGGRLMSLFQPEEKDKYSGRMDSGAGSGRLRRWRGGRGRRKVRRASVIARENGFSAASLRGKSCYRMLGIVLRSALFLLSLSPSQSAGQRSEAESSRGTSGATRDGLGGAWGRAQGRARNHGTADRRAMGFTAAGGQ